MRYRIRHRNGWVVTWSYLPYDRDEPLTFPDQQQAACFIIDHNLPPHVYYWEPVE